jgi:protein-S-isoprenylcysteine O-methyltransferase Ste14
VQLALADVIRWGCVGLLSVIGVWFASAVHHFDKRSPRKPLLFALLVLSTAVAVATIATVARSSGIPELRCLAAALLGLLAALLFQSGLRATRHRALSLAFSRATPPKLVISGPYRQVRHPLYSAYVLFWSSCALLAGTAAVALLVAGIAVLYVIAARMEEADIMASKLAPEYSKYRAATGMLLPNPFKARLRS